MRFVIIILFGLCISATARPSQTDDDDGQIREAEYETDDGAQEYIQEEKEARKNNKRSYEDQAQETEDYSEPDSEDPSVKNDRQFLGDHKLNGEDDVRDPNPNAKTEKDDCKSRDQKSNVYKRTSQTEKNEPTPDETLKDKLYKNFRDQRNEYDIRGHTIQKNEEFAEKVTENLYDRHRRESDHSSSAEKGNKNSSNKMDTVQAFDSIDSVDTKNKKDLSRKYLEDLLNSLSIEKINILKKLINEETVAKRDIEKKSIVDGDKSTDITEINVRESQENCHASIPTDSEIPHSIHSISTSPPSGCEIKIPSDMCNLTTPNAELSDTDTIIKDKTQSKELKFMDDTLTEVMDMRNENNKEIGDLENIANMESYYDFSEHRNNYKEDANGNTGDYSDFQKFDDKLLKRDTSIAEDSIKSLEDSFPKDCEKLNSDPDSDLEPLVRVKRTEGKKYSVEDSKRTCPKRQNSEVENINFDTDNILTNNEEVDSNSNDNSRKKRADDEYLVSELYDTCETISDTNRNLGDNNKLGMIYKILNSQDADVDGLENMAQLKDVNRYKRIRQANEQGHK